MEANYPYAIKNQRGASKKPLVGGFGCDELVLYGIRVLAEQLLGTVLDIEVDHTGPEIADKRLDGNIFVFQADGNTAVDKGKCILS